jgi:hypothetical protein
MQLQITEMAKSFPRNHKILKVKREVHVYNSSVTPVPIIYLSKAFSQEINKIKMFKQMGKSTE